MTQVPDGALLDRGRDAFGRSDWAEAHAALSEADRSGELGPGDLAMLADAAYFTAQPRAAVEAWERAHRARLRAGDRAGAAEAASRLSFLLLDTGEFAALHTWIRRADRLLDGLPESSTHAALAVTRGFMAIAAGEVDEALEWGRQAAEIGARVDDADSATLGRNVEGRALIFQGHVDEGLALLDETTVAAVSGELEPFTSTIVYCSSVCGTQALADYERAEEWTKAMDGWCSRRSMGTFHGWCRIHGAEIKRLRGRLREAEAEASQAYEEVRSYWRLQRGWPLYEVGLIRLRLGELNGAEEAFKEAHRLGWDPQPGLALLRLAQGNVEAAASSIRDAVENPSHAPNLERPPTTDLRMAPFLEAQVEIEIEAGDLEAAGRATDELERVSRVYGIKALRASALTARGRVLLAQGDAAAARDRLAEGVTLWTELGTPYETARTRVALAAALRVAGSAERAALELSTAHATFDRLGAKLDARRAAAELRPERPADPEDRVFMFTDIVSSTDLVDVIGDEAWGHLVRWHNTTLASLLAAHGAEMVRSTGDGFFVTFEVAGPAVECAVAIQRALEDHRRDHGFSPRVRIGLHRARATREGGDDWSGVGVHAAARIGALAEGDEILASREAAEAAGEGVAFSGARTVSVKGISRPLEVVVVGWRRRGDPHSQESHDRDQGSDASER